MSLSSIEDTVTKYGKIIISLLKDSANNPPLLGIELIGIGSAVKSLGLDFVLIDFTGKHLPSPAAQITATMQALPVTQTTTPTPTQQTTAQKAATQFQQWAIDLNALIPGGSLLNAVLEPAYSAIDTATNTTAPTTPSGGQIASGLPNLLSLLGINLPTQITLSEVLILGGLLLLSEPLLQAIAGSVSSLMKAAPALALG